MILNAADFIIRLLLLSLFYFQCQGFSPSSPERILIRDNTAIYSVAAKQFFQKNKLEFFNQDFPLTKQTFSKIVSSLIVEKQALTDRKIRILSDTDVIEEVFTALQKNKILYIITMRPDPLSPYTRIYRNSFYCFSDGNSLNFVFGEIEQNIDFQNQYSSRDWNYLQLFAIQPLKATVVLEKEFYILNEIDNKVYNNWLKVPYVKTNSQTDDSLAEKLNKLKILYEKGLIDEKSYRKKVEQLLEDL